MPRAIAGPLLVVGLLIVPLPFLRKVPRWTAEIDDVLHRIGGTTRLECGVALFFLGIACAAARNSLRPSILRLLVCLVSLIFLSESAGRIWWRFAAPGMWVNRPGYVQQSTGLTCSSAAAAMLLHQHGIAASEGELAYMSNTSLMGASMRDMEEALRIKLDGTAWRPVLWRGDYARLLEEDSQCTAAVDLPGIGGHAILIQRAFSDNLLVVDPLSGTPNRMSRTHFESIWDGTVLMMVKVE
jgi:hypothetical protein